MSVKETVGAENQEVLFTQEEFDKKLQSETDKRVQEALKTAQAKWEKDVEGKLEQARTEAERLAKLSADEKKAEEDKQRAKELADKDRELTMRELQLGAIDELNKRKLPVSFAKMLLGDTAEHTLEKITAFEKEYKEAIDAEVTARTKGRTPDKGGGTTFDMNEFIRNRGK